MEQGKRYIAHIDLDSFFVSVERLGDRRLYGKPVLIGGASDRGVVASCSYEARKFGIHSAMPMVTARRLCPSAIIIPGNHAEYSQASRLVTSIIADTVPLFEKTSIDEFYIDMTGMDTFYNCYQIMSDLRRRIITETGLPISFGLSPNRTVSKVATGVAKPNGQLFVAHGTEKRFLAPLPVKKIPMIGARAVETLLSLGIQKVGELQRHPLHDLERVFGKAGRMMWEKANGIDEWSVIPYTERKSISSEHTFHQDTTDVKGIEQLLISMTEQLTYKLRQEGKSAANLAVKIRYANFQTNTQQITIDATNSDPVLFPLIKDLFKKAYKGQPVRLVGVRLGKLQEDCYQPGLFDDHERNQKLYKALDKINSFYGSKTVSRAATMGIRNRDFNPFGKE